VVPTELNPLPFERRSIGGLVFAGVPLAASSYHSSCHCTGFLLRQDGMERGWVSVTQGRPSTPLPPREDAARSLPVRGGRLALQPRARLLWHSQRGEPPRGSFRGNRAPRRLPQSQFRELPQVGVSVAVAG